MPPHDPAAAAVALDEASILAEAAARAELDDFGSDEWVEPMRVLLAAFEAEGRMHAAGRAMMRERVVGLLVNRARAQDWFTRHPEILEEEIAAPVIIVGLPRTGSTMLHRTLAADPRMVSLKWYESRNPAPFPGWTPATAGEPDPRVAVAEGEIAGMLAANPDLDRVHPFKAESADEEIMLLEFAFMCGNPPAFVNVPSYFAWLESHDNRPAYAYMKRLLQFLQWQKRQRGEVGERWAMKTPHHLMHLDLLCETFPNATVIHTHRDILDVIPSFASMNSEIRMMASDRVDPRETGEQWCRRFALAMRRYIDERERREQRGDTRFIDVWYKDAVVDPVGQVRRIYEHIGMDFTSEAEQYMLRWADLNRREGRPSHDYTLEQFGFDAASLERDFAAYQERFIAPHLG